MTADDLFFDTEFLVGSAEGIVRMELISIGIAGADGRELYLENSRFDWDQPGAGGWLADNVRPHLLGPGSVGWCEPPEMAERITAFVAPLSAPRFWAYNGASDWVVLMSLYGDILNRPSGWPSGYRELKHHLEARGRSKRNLPPQEGTEHHALADARWNLACFRAAR